MPEFDVLIAGAGPTGLVLALWLHAQGVKLRIIDQGDGPAPNSRALAVHARIIELYRQLDLADELIEHGYQLPATNIWVNGSHRAHVNLREWGTVLTPYPYLLTFPQDEHERLLEKRLNSFGIFVERKTKLQTFVDNNSSITATLVHASGDESTCEAAYIVGCDGAHSVVRHTMGAKYEGDTYVPLFYITDIVAEDQASPLFNGEAHLTFVDETFNLILPYVEERHFRVIGTTIPRTNPTHTDSSEPQSEVTFEDVLPEIQKTTKMQIQQQNVNWFSTYRSHHRVADKFRSNRAFLVGDAAHIHSPVGGQGMNTGIMDAINLAWKLATVIKQPSMTEEAKNALLGTYEPERRSFALDVVGATDHGFTILTSPGFLPHMLRAWVIPYLLPLVTRFQAARMEIFRRGSQLVCSYRGSSLNQPFAGSETVQPGDRLPWVKTELGDNFSTLCHITWQIHVYGAFRSGNELEEWCKRKHIRLTVFEWDDKHGNAGLHKGAAYLLRPDQYIAGIFEGDDMQSKLDEYFSTRGL